MGIMQHYDSQERKGQSDFGLNESNEIRALGIAGIR